MWTYAQRTRVVDLPLLVGCTTVGEDWKFYIASGVEGPAGILEEVRIWGPLSDLAGRTTSPKHTTSLLRILRRVMLYTVGHHKQRIFISEAWIAYFGKLARDCRPPGLRGVYHKKWRPGQSRGQGVGMQLLPRSSSR
ncbi:hypothetical protein NUU61_007382 [Penicillium alfredii]|uniref:PD-(D/E)XK nuclease-like domain-containing protein n=1 Tax=Penicillium alfredii TaxID=1506179 RepID=A0A9W9F2Y9_9EURO|nr:uncharacterized protein NUU61_007382 [Penicillium alfredii]KAJ5092512.1 hypothetical protein NUU61_007382 [Penicillium alfredii]